MKKVIITILTGTLLWTGTAAAQYCGGPGPCGPGEGIPVWDTKANPTHWPLQLARMLVEIGILKDQYENMLLNTKRGSNGLSNPMPLLLQLQELLQRAQGIGYPTGGVDAVFRERYPGYIPYTEWHVEYGMWSGTAMDTLANTLANLNRQAQEFPAEAGEAQELESASANSTGRMAAIQQGNRIGAAMLNQILKLKQVMMADSSARVVLAGKNESMQAQKDAWTHRWLIESQREIPEYGRSGTGVFQVPYPGGQ